MTQVGRYQIVDELGRGAMGVVYKAQDPAIGRTVAIKAIRLIDFEDPAERQRIRDRLLREVQSAGVLSHPNIVTIYDIVEDENYAYILMEYVHGLSLEKMLRKRSLPESGALVDFLRQIAEALDYAHRRGIIHRDIKPANIVIADETPEPVAKVMDFGVAKLPSHDMTQGGSMIGTPSYMSPEQIQGTVVDGRSDQFSLAVMVYELLTGEKPFAADNLPALFYLICKQDPKPLHRINPTLSEAVDKVLQRALAKEPLERFATAGDFIGTLSVALDQCSDWIPAPVFATAARASMAEPRAYAAAGVESQPTKRARTANGSPYAAATAVFAPPRIDGEREGTQPVPPPPSLARYELPELRRRSRREEDDGDESAPETKRGTTFGIILAICLAIVGVIVFAMYQKPAPNVPVQVLDTKSAPAAPPPPEDMEAPAQPPQTSTQPAQAPSAPSSTAQTNQQQPAQAQQNNTSPNAARAQEQNQSRSTAPPAAAPRENSNTTQGGEGDVDLVSDPPGAKVVVDGDPASTCTSPCTMSLPQGRHTMTIQLDGYTVARRIFNVPETTRVFVPLSKETGTVVVTSTPSGSSVFVDGKPYGQTPVTLHLPAGTHQLLVRQGSQQEQETINIDPGAFITRSLRW